MVPWAFLMCKHNVIMFPHKFLMPKSSCLFLTCFWSPANRLLRECSWNWGYYDDTLPKQTSPIRWETAERKTGVIICHKIIYVVTLSMIIDKICLREQYVNLKKLHLRPRDDYLSRLLFPVSENRLHWLAGNDSRTNSHPLQWNIPKVLQARKWNFEKG